MKIVRKSKPGQPPILVGESASGEWVEEDEYLLDCWYANHYSAGEEFSGVILTDGDISIGRRHYGSLNGAVAQVLKTLRRRQLWIACECQQVEGQLRPLLCPVQLDSWGYRYSFRRIRNHVPHHPACIFHTPGRLEERFAFDVESIEPDSRDWHIGSQNFEPDGGQAAKKIHALRPLAANTSFAIDVADTESVTLAMQVTPPDRLNRGHQAGRQARPKLARMLFTLLEEAHLQTIAPGWWKHRNYAHHQLHSLLKTKRSIINRIPLKHYLTTQPQAIVRGCRKLETLAQAGKGNWPPNVKPQAFFSGIVSDVNLTELTLTCSGHPLALLLEEPPICFSPPHGHPSGPFWAMAHLGESLLQPGRYVLRQAYLHPVFSQSLLVPVDSDAERQTLELLLTVQKTLYGEGIAIAITKPLHDLMTEAGEPYRPDFVLYPYRRGALMQPGHCLVVETMGFADADYRDRKARTHQRMQELGEVMALDFSRRVTGDLLREYQCAILNACEKLSKRPILKRSFTQAR